MLTLVTFGDSVLDCGRYNAHGVTPGQLLVANDDTLFPEFTGQDLACHGGGQLVHRAVDGATSADLAFQGRRLDVASPAVALLSIGGNDLLWSVGRNVSPDPNGFADRLDAFLAGIQIRPVLIATIYDPTFGDDRRAFLDVDPEPLRRSHRQFNEVLAQAAARVGRLVDLHRHFLSGDPSWFTHDIEPSLIGASEIRRCFWPAVSDLT